MSNTEHLFETALYTLWRSGTEEEWREQNDRLHNTEGVSEETIDALWEAALYIVYTQMIPKDWDIKYKPIDNWGHWVPIDDEPHEEWECDRCGYTEYAEVNDYVYNSLPNYCPNCGAAMFSELLEENEDEKDKEEN